MTGVTQPALAGAPEWVTAEMPPGYQTRLQEIERLSADLHAMDAIGRILWEEGQPLGDAVTAVFAALDCQVGRGPYDAGPIAVTLAAPRRLIVVIAASSSPVEKTSDELALAFRAVQFASEGDRVLLVPGNDRATPPAARSEPVHADALGMLQRMGVVVLTTTALFRLWRLSLEDGAKAKKALDRLHAQDGGPFVVASSR